MLVWVGLIGKKTLSANVSADRIFFLCRVTMKILQEKNLSLRFSAYFASEENHAPFLLAFVENNATIVYRLHINAVMFVQGPC